MISIDESINKALDDMKSKVSFDEVRHIYTDVETGVWLQGVSSISSIIPKDWLAAWGAKEAVKFLGYSDFDNDIELAEKMLEKIKNSNVKQYLTILKEAKGASSRKNKKAMLDGRTGHSWLESLVLAKMQGDTMPALPGGDLDRSLKQFIDWEKQNIDHWIASEAVVSDTVRGYAGTLDAIGVLKGGKLALIDFKFATHIGEDYYLQTAGYAAPFENYNIFFDERIIIRLPKTLYRDEWNAKLWKYEKQINNIEVRVVPTNYKVDRDIFYHLIPIKGYINYLTKK